MLAAYELERRGIQVATVDRDDVDLWVRTPTGRMLTVQVKATSVPQQKHGLPRYHFSGTLRPIPVDLYALVVLDLEIMLVCPCADARVQWCNPDIFSPEAMDASIKEYLA